jgi:hypothetical protein
MDLRMQPRNEKFLTLFCTAGSNVVAIAAILTEFVTALRGHLLRSPAATASTPRFGGGIICRLVSTKRRIEYESAHT